MSITRNEYNTFTQAYEYFNDKLFGGKLPDVIITLQHGKRYYGYFWQHKFDNRQDSKLKIGEMALNPDLFKGRSDAAILSTLVHEQCHIWQAAYGKPGKKGYHNKEWADKMKAIGLQPSDTGATGGKETGEKMSHFIIKLSLFDTTCDALIKNGFALNWQSYVDPGKPKKAKQTRAKFICPECDQAAWAKPTANLTCGDCDIQMVCTIEEEGE